MERKESERLLTRGLKAGAVYFLGVALAHVAMVKLPGLYVYYSVPSHGYQDKIIGILAFGWAVFLWAASANEAARKALRPAVITAGIGNLAGLILINVSPDMAAMSTPRDLAVFWIETGMLASYFAWLCVCFWQERVR